MPTIRKLSAVDEVFQTIREQIVSGALPQGYRFSTQKAMAAQMGVSRPTIREAINKLTMLGLLEAKPGVGTTVVGDGSEAVAALGRQLFLKSAEVTQFMEARLYLEKAAVRLAVLKATDEDLAGLETNLAEQAAALQRSDLDMFSRLDASFHRLIIANSCNQVLMRFLDLIWDGLSRFVSEVNVLRSASENALHFHRQLLKHLQARNLPQAEKTLLEHLRDVALSIERSIGSDIGLSEMFRLELGDFHARRRPARPAARKTLPNKGAIL